MFSLPGQHVDCANFINVNNMFMSEDLDRAWALMQAKIPPWDWADLARAVHATDQRLYNWRKRGGIPSGMHGLVADALGTSVDYLTGRTSITTSGESSPSGTVVSGPWPTTPSVSEGPDIRGHVPLISWVQAGDWNHADDPLQPGDADQWLPCPSSHGQRTYALRVRGDSMTATHGKSYPEGCVIFVDPDQKSPANGARIIAKLSGSDEVTFKVLVMDAGRTWLKPLNPQHPPILDEFRVLGTVIGKWEDE